MHGLVLCETDSAVTTGLGGGSKPGCLMVGSSNKEQLTTKDHSSYHATGW